MRTKSTWQGFVRISEFSLARVQSTTECRSLSKLQISRTRDPMYYHRLRGKSGQKIQNLMTDRAHGKLHQEFQERYPPEAGFANWMQAEVHGFWAGSWAYRQKFKQKEMSALACSIALSLALSLSLSPSLPLSSSMPLFCVFSVSLSLSLCIHAHTYIHAYIRTYIRIYLHTKTCGTPGVHWVQAA